MVRQSPEKAYIFDLALRCKIAANTPARVDYVRAEALWQGNELTAFKSLQRCLKGLVIQIQQLRRARFIDGIKARFGLQRCAPGVVLILDAVPAFQPVRRQLVIKADHRAGHIVKQGFHTRVKIGGPMLDALMLSPGGYCLV